MLTYTSHFVQANGLKLHYYRTGGSKPPFVLLHGITDDGLCWTPVAEWLSKDYDVIMMDARGHGISDDSDGCYTMRMLAEDLAGLIVGLGLEKPLLLGHSMGAITILTMTGLYPELPQAILLEDPPPFWGKWLEDEKRKIENKLLAGWISSIKRKTYSDLLAEASAANQPWQESEIEPWINAKHRFSPRISGMANLADLAELDYPRILQQVTCPVLFMSANNQLGGIATKDDIERLNEWIPQMQICHFEGAGHNIRRDQFGKFMEVISHFLKI